MARIPTAGDRFRFEGLVGQEGGDRQLTVLAITVDGGLTMRIDMPDFPASLTTVPLYRALFLIDKGIWTSLPRKEVTPDPS